MLEVANETLGALRGRIAKELGLIDNDKFNFLWVVDWPMFEEPTNVIKEQIEHFKAKENK